MSLWCIYKSGNYTNPSIRISLYKKEKTDSLLEEVNDSIEEARNNINDRYTKTEIDELLSNRQPTILFGTTTPASSLGNDGDVYLQYE